MSFLSLFFFFFFPSLTPSGEDADWWWQSFTFDLELTQGAAVKHEWSRGREACMSCLPLKRREQQRGMQLYCCSVFGVFLERFWRGHNLGITLFKKGSTTFPHLAQKPSHTAKRALTHASPVSRNEKMFSKSDAAVLSLSNYLSLPSALITYLVSPRGCSSFDTSETLATVRENRWEKIP